MKRTREKKIEDQKRENARCEATQRFRDDCPILGMFFSFSSSFLNSRGIETHNRRLARGKRHRRPPQREVARAKQKKGKYNQIKNNKKMGLEERSKKKL